VIILTLLLRFSLASFLSLATNTYPFLPLPSVAGGLLVQFRTVV
jgi:hypothetical protein